MTFMRYQGWAGPPAQADLGRVIERLVQANHTTESASWSPPVDIKEEAGRFVIFMEIPGVDLEAVEVEMDKNILSISGQRAAPEMAEGQSFSRQERGHGTFLRRFTLPESADPDGIAASGKNGVLEVVIPKRAEPSPRRIQVGRESIQ